jgi:hypothetical protein
MDRRNALKAIAATAGGFLLGRDVLAAQKPAQFQLTRNSFGWREDKKSLDDFIRRHEFPFVSQLQKEIKGTGEGKATYLHTALETVTGRPFQCRDQGAPDCVSQAYAGGVDILTAVQVALMRMPQRWMGFCASEPIYGGSRVEIGGYNGTGGGSTGHWGAEWLSRYGVLLMQPYPGGYDFTLYNPEKANEYGRKGCPDPLEPLAKLHPVKKVAICNSYSQLRDCIANGCPVIVCSNVGFGDGTCERDSEGFLTRKRRPWYHAMLFAAYDDSYSRPGALCTNSWGSRWVFGPTRGPQPEGTFWIDADTVDVMLSQGDSFAISGFVGFPRLNIPPYILR